MLRESRVSDEEHFKNGLEGALEKETLELTVPRTEHRYPSLGSEIPRTSLALPKRNLSPSFSLRSGIIVLTSGTLANFSKMGIKCKSSLSFLSSYQDEQGIEFSG